MIEYESIKRASLFTYIGPVATLLFALIVGYLCAYFFTADNIITRICGIIMAILFLCYITRYYILFFRSRKDMTIHASLQDGHLMHRTGRSETCFDFADIVFTMSYSSATQMCIIAATDNDYTVLTCPTGNLFIKDGKKALKPFYAINKALMELNSNHINYLRSRKQRGRQPLNIPNYIFEVDFYSKRVKNFIAVNREKFRFENSNMIKGGLRGINTTICETKIVGWGTNALAFITDRMVIFFHKAAPPELAEYSFLLDDLQKCGEFEPGHFLQLDTAAYRITAVGEVACDNFRNLGHIVVHFDGKEDAGLPGEIHVENKDIIDFAVGMTVAITKNEEV